MLRLPGYTIDEHVGASAVNQLYRGRRDRDDEPVVLKLYGPGQHDAWELGLREQNLFERAHGQHIAQCIDLLQHGEQIGLVLRAVPGILLSDYIDISAARRRGDPSERRDGNRVTRRFVRIAMQLARSLATAHSAGLLVRDVHPGCFLIEPTQLDVSLVDLSGAAVLDAEHPVHTDIQDLQSGLPYMAPERSGRMDRKLDVRSDLYSLGVIFYELLTGERPFSGGDLLELVHAHMTMLPTSPDQLAPEIPAVLARLALTLLAKMPEERYQSAEGLYHDLDVLERWLERTGSLSDVALDSSTDLISLHIPEQLYGRDEARSRLLTALGRARVGPPQFVLLSGAHGTGKSTLARELATTLDGAGYFAEGTCAPLGRDVPYAVFSSALGTLIEQIITSPDRELTAWRDALSTHLGPIAGALAEIVPGLSLILSDLAPVPTLGPIETRNRLILACQRFFAAAYELRRFVVLLLDDLQWADAGSLSIVNALLDNDGRLLIVGSFRTGAAEITEAMPPIENFLLRLDRNHADRVTEITLTTLDSDALTALLADTLSCPLAEVTELAALLLRKTDGNPFLVGQFLEYAQRQGLFQRDAHDSWSWDLDGLAETGIPDDAVELMTARLDQLDDNLRNVLAAAACVGVQFDGATLAAALARDEASFAAALTALNEAGLITRANANDQRRFIHDEIQAAAYRLLSASERRERHLRVGSYWLDQYRHPAGASGDSRHQPTLFAIVDQLNDALAPAATATLASPGQRNAAAPSALELAELNLLVSQQSTKSGAYEAARRYADAGCRSLSGETGSRQQTLRFQLTLICAESELILGATDSASARLAELSQLALEAQQALALATRLVRLYNVTRDYQRAVEVGLSALRASGARVPKNPGLLALMRQLVGVRAAMLGKGVDALAKRPETKDPLIIARMALVDELMISAYHLSPRLLLFLILWGVRCTLSRGVCAHSATYLTALALVRLRAGRFRRARVLIDAADRFDKRNLWPTSQPRKHLTRYIAALWFEDVRDVDNDMARSYQQALELGDLSTAAHTEATRIQAQFFRGAPLGRVTHDTHQVSRLCEQAGSPSLRDSWLHFTRVLTVLTGRKLSSASLLLPTSDPPPKSPEQRRKHSPQVIVAGFALGIMDYWEEAFELAESIADVAPQATFAAAHANFYYLIHGLAAACVYASTPRHRPRCRRALARSRAALKRWRHQNDVQAPHCLALIEAEWARIHDRSAEAMRLYALASEHAASVSDFPLQGLADERRAALALYQQLTGDAAQYLRRARDAYANWGATAKLRQLTLARRDLMTTAPDWRGDGDGVYSSDSSDEASIERTIDVEGAIDLATVLQVSRALSEELSLDRVLERVMQSALENAGASKSVLLLVEDGVLRAVAESTIERGFLRHASVALDTASDWVPLSVVRYAERTRRSIIVGEARDDKRFARDPYVLKSRCRSILCMPILRQTRLSGILYLENRLARDAFAGGRGLEALRLISAQAAIAIDNARLYDELAALNYDLEGLVDERTAELASANAMLQAQVEERKRAQEKLLALQRQLVDTARAAGMAEIATGVLHNVGNTLNSVNVSVEVLEEQVHSSRLPELERALELLRANVGNLDSFLRNDSRGRRLLPFLDMLVERLRSEHSDALAELAVLQRHMEHIRAIVHKQQDYAGSTSASEMCQVSDIVADALDLAGTNFANQNIQVALDIEDTPPVAIDRHKTLQIIANLLSNAEHAVAASDKPDKHIAITTRCAADGQVQIRIADNGVGIPPDTMPKLFTYGFTTRPGGHGFGLHNSFLAARSMRGSLRAESGGSGNGADFVLELPTQTDTLTAPTADEPA